MLKLSPFLKARGIAILFAVAAAASGQALREAPNPGATPLNQLIVAGNACGPAALLSAFRFGDKNWQRAAAAVPGDTERERILSIIRTEGSRPSAHMGNRVRWSKKGVNVVDLCDMANEMTAGHFLPKISYEIFFLKPGESQKELVKRAHARLANSMARGLPPLISIRRFALRKEKNGRPEWTVIDAHFVTVVSVPKKLEKNADSFAVSYLDPWGGKRCEGRIGISGKALFQGEAAAADPSVSPCLEAAFPQASVGKRQLRAGEDTVLTLAAGIGRW